MQCLTNTAIMKIELPPIEELKKLVKEPGNLTFYKRTEWSGPKESVEYLKRKIKEFNTFMDEGKEDKKPPGNVGI